MTDTLPITEIRALLGDAKPAVDGLLLELARVARDYRAYRAGEKPTVLHGLQLAMAMGERMPFVLRRLVDAETQLARMTVRVAEMEATTDHSIICPACGMDNECCSLCGAKFA